MDKPGRKFKFSPNFTIPILPAPRNRKRTPAREADPFLPINASAHPSISSPCTQKHLPSTCHVPDPHQTPSSPYHSTLNQPYPQKIPTYPFIYLKQPTLNFTTNPVLQPVSRFTSVSFNGVLSGLPPFGISSMRSLCCA